MREQIPDDGDARRAGGNHVRRCLQRNTPIATTGRSEAIRAASLTRASPTTGSCPVAFVGAKDRPDGDVRDRLLYSRFDLLGVCGVTDDRAGSEQAACSGRRESPPAPRALPLRLPERHVHAIVHDHARAMRSAASTRCSVCSRNAADERCFARNWIRRAPPSRNARARLATSQPARLGGIDVENGVKSNRTDVLRAYTASASGPDFAFGTKRSMNAVPSRPATKSGSARILRCRGTVVLMPSMTVISSVRRMRAIASCRSRPWAMILASSES